MANKTKERKRMTAREMKAFTSTKFDTVRMLLESGKSIEAMVYMFTILARLVEEKHDVKRTASTTIKEYFTDLVKDARVPAENVHPFVMLMEEALYSHHAMPRELFVTYKDRWASLYKDITGDMAPSL